MIQSIMSTRIPMNSRAEVKAGTSTEYQLHKSQQTIFSGIMHKVIDFTEHRLKRYALNVKDPGLRATLLDLVKRYTSGQVAISWRAGRPVWLAVTKDT